MAEKDFDKRIAEAMAALDAYSAEQEHIERLYEQAKQNLQSSAETQKQALEASSKQAQNQAAVQSARLGRNIYQKLASRGLAFSGENAQTAVDLSLALQNELSGIESDKRKAMSDVDQKTADKQTELDLARASERAGSSEKVAKMRAELAGILAEADGTGSTSSLEEPAAAGVTVVRRPGETEMHYLMRKALTLASYSVSQTTGGTQATDPEIHAQELAKQMVKAVGKNGKISGYTQQKALKEMLDAMVEENNFGDAYYRELMLNLRSMGYRPEYEDMYESLPVSLNNEGTKLYYQAYDRQYNLYRLAGMGSTAASAQAKKDALFEQMAFYYTHCKDEDIFEALMWRLDMNENLYTFYRRLDNEKTTDGAPKYTVGSAL